MKTPEEFGREVADAITKAFSDVHIEKPHWIRRLLGWFALMLFYKKHPEWFEFWEGA